MSGGNPSSSSSGARFGVGAHVVVWNRFVGAFRGEFEVVDVEPRGLRLRRLGDRDPLPEPFAPDQLVRRDELGTAEEL
jgi:hypothetical protein